MSANSWTDLNVRVQAEGTVTVKAMALVTPFGRLTISDDLDELERYRMRDDVLVDIEMTVVRRAVA